MASELGYGGFERRGVSIRGLSALRLGNPQRVLVRILLSALVSTVCTRGFCGAPVEDRSIEVTYAFEQPRIKRVGEFAWITISSCDNLHRIGEPALPFQTARVLLPPGYTLRTVQVRPTVPEVVLAGNWKIDFGRTPLQIGAEPRSKISEEPNARIYKAMDSYPGSRFETLSVQRLVGCDVALIRIFPVQYVPARGELLFAAGLKLRLELAAGRKSEFPKAKRGQKQRLEQLTRSVDNPGLLVEHQAQSFASHSTGSVGCDYLLITRAALVPCFEPLLMQKTRSGLLVQTETVEEIAANYSGRDLPEKIRNCIRFAHTNWGIRFALLGGDTQIVPCRYAYVNNGMAGADFIPSDLYYACLDGSWNSNDNEYWGEPTDGDQGGDVDLLAEVYVGRAPVETATEANTFVEKTIRYETSSIPNPRDALFLGAYLGYFSPTIDAQGGDMLDVLLPDFHQFKPLWLDDRPYTTVQWQGGDAIEALNQSPHLAVYAGHGDAASLMRFSNDYLSGLTNPFPFLAYSVSCNAGQFDNDIFSQDCIGEDLVKGSASGAFAAVLNSREGWFAPLQEWKFSGEFQFGFFRHLLAGDHKPIGAANHLSREGLAGQLGADGGMTYRWCYYEITLFGDPSLPFQLPRSPDGFAVGITPETGGCLLRWPSQSGQTYAVYCANNVVSNAFFPLTNGLPATPPSNTFFVPFGEFSMRFYKITAQSQH